jgi:GT2 family glycosyltransferase
MDKLKSDALITVLLATYNWPEALSMCLHALNAQSDGRFEVVVADDGSRSDTAVLIQQFQNMSRFALRHVWQEDDGFRKAKILNTAIHQARGEYLVFLDGDCLVQPDFIARHRDLARRGHLVTGSRVLLNDVQTQKMLAQQRLAGLLQEVWSFARFKRQLFLLRSQGAVNKCLPFVMKFPFSRFRVYSHFVWRRIKGCNMACWKSDADKVGGFDEALTGWGHEDADFVFRLQDAGVRRTSGAWATEVLHLHHKIGDKSQEQANAQRVRQKILSKRANPSQ